MAEPRFALPPQYDPHAVERPLYQRWLDRGVFTARADSPKAPYVIVIPPPNVTAILHVGHGLNNIIQDVLIRFERMRGREAEWLPGTDHAGIATQNVVERLLAEAGKTRFDLGRAAFVERVWAFVRETGNAILEQLKVIGCSCDWSRTRFTLDPAYSRAVREVFVRLWNEGLIYRGHRVIHWCPHCLTALSDEEAQTPDTPETGKLYYIRYPVVEGPAPYLTVATTRPETMLGDTAVAVNPRDKRHARFVGKTARLPIANVSIPIIADDAVDPAFGTGFVKVTPAHDANDFEIGLRHKLEMPLVMTEDGRMGELTDAKTPRRQDAKRVPPELEGLDRFEAREKIVAMLQAQGLLEKTEPRALARDVRELDGEHPRLEHLAAAVVGAPHPGVHLRQVRRAVGRAGGPEALPQVRRAGRAGSRCARHLVLVVALAVRGVRLARAHRRPRALLSRSHAGHRPRYHLLLGRAHDHGRLSLHG